MRFQIDQGSVSIGGKQILDHCSLEIRGREKIGIVGENGAGKTTLLRLISGQLVLDRDDKCPHGIWIARNTTIEMLEQNPFPDKEETVEEIIKKVCPTDDIYSQEAYDFETEYHKIFTMFDFKLADKNKKIGEFSGGQQTKIALIRLLLMKPDIMLLDEPTNHLDLKTIQWLEQYLRGYEKAVLMVSHDRYFLDQVADVIYEIDHGKTIRYAGNYTDYRTQREDKIRILTKRYHEQQEEIARLNQLIGRFKNKPKKASMARSKKKTLERMERIDPPEQMSYMYPGEIIPSRQSSKWIYDCQKMVIGYEKPLQELNLRVKRGQKIGIIGENGIGKTTFLKTLTREIPLLSGKIFEGTNIDMVYYDQMTSEIDSKLRILEDFQEHFPAYSIGDCRKILARFLFKKEDAAKQIHSLSGGEKARYVFARLLENKPNVLLLDEPTNHLDIPAREILESAFSNYQGTLLFITHDRYFLKEVADALLIFEKGKVTYYPYDYETYLEKISNEERRSRRGIHSVEEENEALQRSLEAVPERTRMQSASLSTDQSYCDWQLTLAGEELQKKQKDYQHRLEELPVDDMSILAVYHDYFQISRDDWKVWLQETERIENLYVESACGWYERWMDYEEVFPGENLFLS